MPVDVEEVSAHHAYLEQTIVGEAGEALLNDFKLAAENQVEYDGDIAFSGLFKVWMASLRKQLNEENCHNIDNEENEDDCDDNDKIIDEIVKEQAQKDISPEQNSDNFAGSFANISVITCDPIENIEIGAIATVLTEGDTIHQEFDAFNVFENDYMGDIYIHNTNVIDENVTSADVQAPGTSKNALESIASGEANNNSKTTKNFSQLLSDLRSMELPKMKRKYVKKPSVISSTANIQKKHDLLAEKQKQAFEKQMRKLARAAKPKKRATSLDSFIASPTSPSSVTSTPQRPRQKRTVKLSKRAKLLSPTSSSAPATPSSAPASPSSNNSSPRKRKTNIKTRVKRPLFSSENDSN